MKTYPNPKSPSSSNDAAKKKTGSEPASFFDVVYKIARKIPKGRVTTYGAIAEAADIKLTPRMVGWAMNGAGRAKPVVPAHRVVNRNGELSGRHFFATPTLMQELLEQEGVTVKNDKITDFKTVFWDPGARKAPAAKKAVKKKA
ncbi:MGMT family protein [Chitinophaga flava]|uniref:Cysteine methyltransferase n=1 Tax=Chitinophaga flava TaxID=2259036 RepID=A0A365Y5X5_9BACT|nr:MGMT family protein [Chitinophaga flava]RBL93728.1 cysteine methyltransferase [Chitinophaga flava]